MIQIKKAWQFYQNHVKGICLTVMLTIPFLLYVAARFGTDWQVMALTVLMALNMLVALKKA